MKENTTFLTQRCSPAGLQYAIERGVSILTQTSPPPPPQHAMNAYLDEKVELEGWMLSPEEKVPLETREMGLIWALQLTERFRGRNRTSPGHEHGRRQSIA